MSVAKLSDLLPIPSDDLEPNAYQVFGLVGCEQDNAKVTAAMKVVYQKLKKSQATADPAIWKRAAELAETARNVLEDPEQRRSLDRQLSAAGSHSQPENGQLGSASRSPANDPLAALLPQSQPLASTSNQPFNSLAAGQPTGPAASKAAPASTTPASTAAAILGIPPGMQTPAVAPLGAGSGIHAAASLATTQTSAIAAGAARESSVTGPEVEVAAPVPWAPSKPIKKRQRKSIGPYLFSAFVVLMLAAIVGLLQFLTGGGKIAVGPAGLKVDEGVAVAEPMPAADRPRPNANPNDGILGAAVSSGIADVLRPAPTEANQEDSIGSTAMEMPEPSPASEMPLETAMDVPMEPSPMPEPSPEPAPMPRPTPEPAPPPAPTAEDMAAVQSRIEAVEQLIRSANWSEMKPAAEALSTLQLNEEQSQRADALFDIADLASFYRGAIARGLATLSTGNTFEYVEGVPVIVVEVSTEKLVIQFNKKSKSFTIDEMPPRLTEKIISFSLPPERPDTIAGQALYRLIDLKTRTEYREDTFEVLAGLDGQLEQVDTIRLLQVAKEILAQ